MEIINFSNDGLDIYCVTDTEMLKYRQIFFDPTINFKGNISILAAHYFPQEVGGLPDWTRQSQFTSVEVMQTHVNRNKCDALYPT